MSSYSFLKQDHELKSLSSYSPLTTNHSTPSFHPIQFHGAQPPPNQHHHQNLRLKRIMIDGAKALVLPAIAIAYISFCFTAHKKVIPITSIAGVDDPSKHLATIKAGITTITIVLITIALYPLKSLIGDLKGEEFFRSVANQNGAPLSTANAVSTLNFGLRDSLRAIFGRHTSVYFFIAFVSGSLSIATSALAPAALSVDSVLVDGGVLGLRVGSIGPDTVFNNTRPNSAPLKINKNLEMASLTAWAETTLRLNNGFRDPNMTEPDALYLAPLPVDLDISVKARWISDIVILRPSCEWAQTDAPSVINIPANVSEISGFDALPLQSLNVSKYDLRFSGGTLGLAATEAYSISGLGMPTSTFTRNTTNDDLVTDGSAAWMISTCITGCRDDSTLGNYVNVSLADVPHHRVVTLDNTFDVAYLLCRPNIELSTREVRNDGQGSMEILPTVYPSQGNIPLPRMRLLAQYVMANFPALGQSGPQFPGALHSVATARIMFGDELVDKFLGLSDPSGGFLASGQRVDFVPTNLTAITQRYGPLVRSSAKSFLGGTLGMAVVPARLQSEMVVFTTSLPHIAVSTLLFSVIGLCFAASHFRSHASQFTLLSVGAAMLHSNLPAAFDQCQSQCPREDDAVELLGDRRIRMDKGMSYTGSLQMS